MVYGSSPVDAIALCSSEYDQTLLFTREAFHLTETAKSASCCDRLAIDIAGAACAVEVRGAAGT